MANDPIMSAVLRLSRAEKLQLVEDLWNDLTAVPGAVPWREWHKEELARRREGFECDPESAVSWKDVRRMIQAR